MLRVFPGASRFPALRDFPALLALVGSGVYAASPLRLFDDGVTYQLLRTKEIAFSRRFAFPGALHFPGASHFTFSHPGDSPVLAIPEVLQLQSQSWLLWCRRRRLVCTPYTLHYRGTRVYIRKKTTQKARCRCTWKVYISVDSS